MAIKSKVVPARRKTKSVTKSQAVQLTTAMVNAHDQKRALEEIMCIISNWTDAERKIIGHICPMPNPVAGLKEMRRLLGESIAKCKVITFPVGGKRGIQIAKGA